MITSEDYYRITNCIDLGEFRLPRFTLIEVQHFLIKLGYEIVIHKAPAKVYLTDQNMGGEVWRTGDTFEENRERILAVKPGTKLPDRVDSQEAIDMDFLSVFKKEMKNKLLN